MERKPRLTRITTSVTIIGVAWALLLNQDSNKPQKLEAQIKPIPTPPTEMSKNKIELFQLHNPF